jgi:hypothetical protein
METTPTVQWTIPPSRQGSPLYQAADEPFLNNAASTLTVTWYYKEHNNDWLLMRDVLKMQCVEYTCNKTIVSVVSCPLT